MASAPWYGHSSLPGYGGYRDEDGGFDADYGPSYDRQHPPFSQEGPGTTNPVPDGWHGKTPHTPPDTFFLPEEMGQRSNLFLGGYIPLQNYLYANAGRQIQPGDKNAPPGSQNLDAGLMQQATVHPGVATTPGGTGSNYPSGGGQHGPQQTPTYSPLDEYLYREF